MGWANPDGLLQVYNADPLAAQGITGKGQTIVFFAFDSADQEDLDLFADTSDLPRFTPVVVGGKPEEQHGETAMDLQVAHAIAPDARLVVVNARPTVQWRRRLREDRQDVRRGRPPVPRSGVEPVHRMGLRQAGDRGGSGAGGGGARKGAASWHHRVRRERRQRRPRVQSERRMVGPTGSR